MLIIECADKVDIKPQGDISEQLDALLKSGVDKKNAIKQVAKANGLSKDEVVMGIERAPIES
mgnify:CR=1 FL=1